MPMVDFRGRLRLVGCRIVGFLLELPSLLFGGQFFGVRHGLLLRLVLVSLCFTVRSCDLDSGGFADVGTETFGKRCCVVRVDSRVIGRARDGHISEASVDEFGMSRGVHVDQDSIRGESLRAVRRILLRSSEREQQLDVVLIGSPECFNVTLSNISLRHNVRYTPGKLGAPLQFGQNVGHESCVSSIPIRERMDENESVVKSNRDLIGWECGMFDPVVRVSNEDCQLLADLMVKYTDVLFAGAIQAGPSPCLIEHPAMKLAEVWLR